MVQVFGVDFRHGQAVAAKMLRKFEEGGIFFATAVENANGADALIGKADNLPAGTTELALQRLNARSEEHTSELQSQSNLVCRLLLEKKKSVDVPLPTR